MPKKKTKTHLYKISNHVETWFNFDKRFTNTITSV